MLGVLKHLLVIGLGTRACLEPGQRPSSSVSRYVSSKRLLADPPQIYLQILLQARLFTKKEVLCLLLSRRTDCEELPTAMSWNGRSFYRDRRTQVRPQVAATANSASRFSLMIHRRSSRTSQQRRDIEGRNALSKREKPSAKMIQDFFRIS